MVNIIGGRRKHKNSPAEAEPCLLKTLDYAISFARSPETDSSMLSKSS